jgi:hypothetical protein
MPPRTERRRAVRAKSPPDMMLRIPGLTPARVRDLSANGVCCTTDRPLPVLSHVHLILVIPSPHGQREVPCDGAVVRCVRDGNPGTGSAGSGAPSSSSQTGSAYETAIFFTDIRESDRAAVTEFVSALRSQGAIA